MTGLGPRRCLSWVICGARSKNQNLEVKPEVSSCMTSSKALSQEGRDELQCCGSATDMLVPEADPEQEKKEWGLSTRCCGVGSVNLSRSGFSELGHPFHCFHATWWLDMKLSHGRLSANSCPCHHCHGVVPLILRLSYLELEIWIHMKYYLLVFMYLELQFL